MSKKQESRLLKVYFNMLGCKSKGNSGFAFFPHLFTANTEGDSFLRMTDR